MRRMSGPTKIGNWDVCQHCLSLESDAAVRKDSAWMAEHTSGQTKHG